ncbi:TPA: hypothetical protein NJ492_004688 [Vibrio parahaemolyticus]|nr:hypothetical protein [Vibrio parahaemolyticus]
MNAIKFTLDSGHNVCVQRAIHNADELQNMLDILDDIMVNEEETPKNQTVVEFIFSVINTYENSMESVQNFVLESKGCNFA